MTLQESANSSFVTGASGESLECILNISGLNLVSVLITSDGSLENGSYDIFVSNNASQWHYVRSVALQGTLTSNSFSYDNQSVFLNILSFNHVKIALSGTEGISSSILLSGR